MRRPFVAANWKMHGDAAFIASFAAAWRSEEVPSHADVVICPPFGYLKALIEAIGPGATRFGVQNVAAEPAGAYTGEHAAEMARDLGATFAIVGHSERRRLFGESDDVVATKCAAAWRAGLTPILCVGETLAERRAGAAEATVLAQLDGVVARFDTEQLANLVISYEPVWAIGTGETATADQAQRMHGRIRARLKAVDDALAASARIVYGGSVKPRNARDLFAQPDIDGGLVGGASLEPRGFARICAAAD